MKLVLTYSSDLDLTNYEDHCNYSHYHVIPFNAYSLETAREEFGNFAKKLNEKQKEFTKKRYNACKKLDELTYNLPSRILRFNLSHEEGLEKKELCIILNEKFKGEMINFYGHQIYGEVIGDWQIEELETWHEQHSNFTTFH